MKKKRCTLLFLLPIFLCAQSNPSISSIQTEISNEKKAILNYYPKTDEDFFFVADSLVTYLKNTADATAQLKNLLQFLHLVDNVEYLRNGRYKSVLRYGFLVAEWREKKTLSENLRLYPTLSIQAYLLFADDTCAPRFLLEQAQLTPQEMLRQSDFLGASADVALALEVAVLQDPEYAKRYIALGGGISDLLNKTRNTKLKIIRAIYQQYGTRSRAYLLIDEIEKQKWSIAQADSLGKNTKALLVALSEILTRTQPLAKLSVENELRFAATEQVRNYNLLPAASYQAQLELLDANQLFVLLCLAYNDGAPRTIETLVSAFRKKQTNVATELLQNIQPARLSGFLKFLESSGKLPDILYKTDVSIRNNLLNFLAYDEKTELRPALRVITKAPVSIEENSDDAAAEDDNDANFIVAPFVAKLTDKERVLLSWKKNLFGTLQNIPSFINEPYAKEILLYASKQEPDELLKKVDAYKGKFWCKEVVELAALNAPIAARRYLQNDQHPVAVILHYSENAAVKKLISLCKELGFQSKPMLLFDEIEKGEVTVSQAISICNNNDQYFREIIKLVSRKKYSGMYNVDRELNFLALRFVRGINDKIYLPYEKRFVSVDGLSAEELYCVMVFGREEVFTSTFSGLFARFKLKAQTDSALLHTFSEHVRFRSFVSLCANYGKLEELLALFTPLQKDELLQQFASGIENNDNPLDEAALVSEMLSNCTNDYALRFVQEILKANYERLAEANDSKGLVLYGILVGLCKDKAIVEQSWFKNTARKFKTASLNILKLRQVTDNNATVERMYFYDDDDGRDSYTNFIATFSNRDGWDIEESYNYVKVQSTSGSSILIYANKPSLEISGDEAIRKIFSDNNYVPKVIIHRGHSFHTEKTLSRVPASAMLVIVGSCGGFYQINLALRNAPGAHVISTKQIGVKQINDPLIIAINEYIRAGRDINWKSFWDEMKGKLSSNSLFYDYVPPHKNLESLFVRAYYQILGI